MHPGASPLLPAQLPAPRLSPPFPSSVGSAGLCPRSRSSWQGACTRPQGAGHKLAPCSEPTLWGCFSCNSPGPLSLQGIRAAKQGSGHPILGSFPFQAHLLVLFGAGQESILRAAPDRPGLLPALSPCRPGLDLCLAALRQPAPAWFCAIFPWWHVGVSPFGVGVSYCSACLWSGGLQPAVGVERRRPGRFPACFCGRDGSVPSHPMCSRLCGAVTTLRNGFVHPKLAWRGAQELGQQGSGQGPVHGWWRGDLLWLVKPGWGRVPAPLCPPGVFFGWYPGP